MNKFNNSLILGASGGIGAALAASPHLARVTTLSRSESGFDLLDETSVAATAKRLREESFDLIVNACGALEIDGRGPEKSFRDIDAARMTKAFQINAVGAALAHKYFAPLLRKDGKAVFATLSARVGSIGDNRLGGWMSYRASKAALNQIVRCAAIEYGRANRNAVIVALHPGTIETPLTEKFARGRYTATPAEAAEKLLQIMDSLSAEQSGGFIDYAGEEIPW